MDIQQYAREATEASKLALVEILGGLRTSYNSLVLAGGWAPYFILETSSRTGFSHCGSLDIDFFVDPSVKKSRMYEKIVQILQNFSYEPVGPDLPPASFQKSMNSPIDNSKHLINLDFLSEPLAGELQPGLGAFEARAWGVVLSNFFEHELSVRMHRGRTVQEKVRITNAVGCVTSKALAMSGRRKEKDAYDLYAVIGYYGRGPKDAASLFKPKLSDPLVREAIEILTKKFETSESEGPFNAGFFMHPLDNEAQKRVRTDAFMRLRRFLQDLK